MSEKARLSVSIDGDLVDAAHAAVAAGRSSTVSGWVGEALRHYVEHERRMAALDSFIDAFEAEHGEITDEEIREASRAARARATVVRGRAPAGGRRPTGGERAGRGKGAA
jgi:hypothetical protein